MGVKLGLSHYKTNTYGVFENRMLRRIFGLDKRIRNKKLEKII
jgi:hypothetical protein